MSRLSSAQLAKLSPAEKAARAKRLAYNRRYDAAKKGKRVTRLKKNAVYDAVKKTEAIVAQTVIDQAEVLMSELRDTKNKEQNIVAELRKLFNA